jgi:hypothetical protein
MSPLMCDLVVIVPAPAGVGDASVLAPPEKS